MAFVVVGSFLLGWLIRSRHRVPTRIPALADTFVLQCALPALIFSKISQMDFDGAVFTPVALAWCSMALAAVVFFLIGRILNWTRQSVGALLLVGVLGNTSFLGLGLVEGLLGEKYLSSAIAYDQLGTFLALALYGSFVASRWGRDAFDVVSVIRRLFTFAPFLALLGALVARNFTVPNLVFDVFDPLGRAVGPVAMGALGLRFQLRVPVRVRRQAVFGLAVKMLLIPCLLLMVAWGWGSLDDVAWKASILESAMPPMITAGIVAVGAGMDEDLVAFMVGIGTLLSFATVPLLSLAL